MSYELADLAMEGDVRQLEPEVTPIRSMILFQRSSPRWQSAV